MITNTVEDKAKALYLATELASFYKIGNNVPVSRATISIDLAKQITEFLLQISK